VKHPHQMLMVLSRFRGKKRAAWLKTTIWSVVVFMAALGRGMARIDSGLRWQAP
jgi:hypothetical protein